MEEGRYPVLRDGARRLVFAVIYCSTLKTWHGLMHRAARALPPRAATARILLLLAPASQAHRAQIISGPPPRAGLLSHSESQPPPTFHFPPPRGCLPRTSRRPLSRRSSPPRRLLSQAPPSRPQLTCPAPPRSVQLQTQAPPLSRSPRVWGWARSRGRWWPLECLNSGSVAPASLLRG